MFHIKTEALLKQAGERSKLTLGLSIRGQHKNELWQ